MLKGWLNLTHHSIASARLLRGLSVALAACAWTGLALAQSAAPAAPAAAPTAPATQSTPVQATLPGGANAMQETFGDWRVTCVPQPNNAKRCTLMQEQGNTQTRQRLLAIELGPNADKLEGLLLLPFGVLLDRGAILQMDEQAAMPAMRFRTCMPGGCVIPVTFDAKTTAALRNGTSLKVKVVVENGQEQVLPISLKGFGQALDRIAAVMKG